MFNTVPGFNRGCGCGNQGCGNMGGCDCGCSNNGCFTPNVTPITLPETTCCNHCRMFHEQPLIQPIENRTVRHHNFFPRVYVSNRFTTEDVVEPNNFTPFNQGMPNPNFQATPNTGFPGYMNIM